MKHHKIAHLIGALRERRHERSITQAQLATLLDVPQSYISELEAGGRDPRLSTMLEWSRTLGLELMLVPKQLVLAVNEIVNGIDNVESAESNHSPFKALPQDI